MKTNLFVLCLALLSGIFVLYQCTNAPASDPSMGAAAPTPTYGGYESMEKWGEHLVTVSACHDCHTPKVMTLNGPVLDSTRLLSGHPADMPPPDVDRKALESKGYAATFTLTSWVGPWGISYAANLTSDMTGIGGWEEANFIYAIRNGKLKGLEAGRPLLPPMPWDMYRHMTDDELKAIFAYLKSTKPVSNLVPQPAPPVLAPPVQ